MLGKRQLTIDWQNFIQGASTSNSIQDGGYSPDSDGMNYIIEPGVLHPQSSLRLASGTALSNEIIASSEDPDVSGSLRFFVDDSGRFWKQDTTPTTEITLTATDASASAASGNYAMGTTDMAMFQGGIYASTSINITKLDSSLASPNHTWGSVGFSATLQDNVRHPLLVYENNLWVGDKSNLHTYDGTTYSTNVLALGSTDQITALGIDPGTGRMLVATTTRTDYSALASANNKIHLYDGFSVKPLRTFLVDSRVDAFFNIGGAVFVSYGGNIGYFNGIGIVFLRRFDGSIFYKHHVTNVESSLIIKDKNNIWSYGEIVPGNRVWNKIMTIDEGIESSTGSITNIGSYTLGISYAITNSGGIYKTFNTRDSSTVESSSGKEWFTNKVYFPRQSIIRGVTLETGADMAQNTSFATISLYDDKDDETVLGTCNNTGDEQNERICRLGDTDVLTYTSQLKIAFASQGGIGVRRFMIDYDYKEEI